MGATRSGAIYKVDKNNNSTLFTALNAGSVTKETSVGTEFDWRADDANIDTAFKVWAWRP